MKIIEMIKLIESDGRYLVRTRGSHQQYKHPEKRVWLLYQSIGCQMICQSDWKKVY